MIPCNLFEEEFKQIENNLISLLNELKNKKILITGANGLIGSYLVYFLDYLNTIKKFNLSIIVMSRSKERLEKTFDGLNITILEQDLNEPIKYLIKADYIIHAASNAHPLAYSKDPAGTMKTNLIGTINLLEQIKNTSTKFLYLSSGEIYGRSLNRPFTENDLGEIDTKDVRSCYPESKRAAETLCQSYMAQYGVHINIARLCYIYGATITETNSRADAQFLRNALNDENIVLKSEGLQKRSYCYVADCVSALLTILLKAPAGEVYNIANPDSVVTIQEYAQTLADIAGVKLTFDLPDNIEAKGYSKQTDAVLSAEKLINLGWKANFQFKKGIEHTYKIKQMTHNQK